MSKKKVESKVDARKLLQEEARKAEEACEKAIQIALATHKCKIEPTFVATTQRNVFHLRVAYIGFQE